MKFDLLPGTRRARSGELTISPHSSPPLRLHVKPVNRFQMSGIGYLNPRWNHGAYHDDIAIEREQFSLSEVDVNDPLYIHIQTICRVTCEQEGKPVRTGLGAFEQLILGPYEPLGFGDVSDPSSVVARRSE